MSEAGVRSSIGDDYQDMLAVWWLAQMLTDETLKKIEVESTCMFKGERVRVDDVIVHKDDVIIFCQCKVDHPRCGTWNVTDLKDDLCKAWNQWQDNPENEICFYSSGPFGSLKQLQKRAARMPDVDAFMHEMPKDVEGEYSKFSQIVTQERASPNEIFAFFRQVKFNIESYDSLSSRTKTHLDLYVTQTPLALKLLREEVRRVTCRRKETDQLAAHADAYSINRLRLLELLRSSGLRITPRLSEDEIKTYFGRFSGCGRIWQREIKGHRFVRSQQKELLEHIKGTQSVLIDGSPGSGKTCLLLDLLDYLEGDPHYFCIYLQARDIEDFDIGELRVNFLNSLARMAENLPVVLVVDSLDVLSTAGRQSFTAVLTLMDQVRKTPNTCVVASCRTFDLQYDPQLSAISWPQKLHLNELDFDTAVSPLLLAHGVDPQSLPAEQKTLVCNPRMLKMFLDIAENDAIPTSATAYSLSEIYLDKVIMQNKLLGSSALEALRALSAKMIEEKKLSIPKRLVSIADNQRQILLSEGILIETSARNYTFSHQTLVDVLAVEYARGQGQTLSMFMASMPAVPFIRPTIRYFFFSLYNQDGTSFRKQLRRALADPNHAFHLKRLLATSLAETAPDPNTLPLLRSLFDNDASLFSAFFEKAHPQIWFDFFQQHFLPEWKRKQNWPWLLRYSEWLRRWKQTPSEILIELWTWLLENASEDQADNTAIAIVNAFDNFDDWDNPALQTIFTILVHHPISYRYDFVCKPLSRWIDTIDSHDGMLWDYITRHTDSTNHHNINLKCEEYIFYEKNFFAKRLQQSEYLLNMALFSLDEWSKKTDHTLADGITRTTFLYETSCGHRRTNTKIHHSDSIDILLNAVEQACIKHAEQNSNWWKAWAQCLWENAECALRYMALCGLIRNPQSNLPLVERILLHLTDRSSHYLFDYELSLLLGAASPHLDMNILQEIQDNIILLHEDQLAREETNIGFVWKARRDYLIEIPGPYRSPESIAAIATAEKLCGTPPRAPSIESRGGIERSPVSCEQLIEFSASGLLKILQYYGSKKFEDDWGWSDVENDHIIGGSRSVAQELAEAASIDPERFYQWSQDHWADIIPKFQAALLRGIAEHAQIRFGNLGKNNWKAKSTPSEESLFNYLLQLIKLINWSEFDAYCLQSALSGCAWLTRSSEDLDRLYPLLYWCSNSEDPVAENCEDLHSVGLSSMRGIAARAAFVIASHWLERGQGDLPDQLASILHQLAEDPHPAVRDRVLRGLPTLLHYSQDIGWQLFQKAVAHGPASIWDSAYMCLYYNYRQHLDIVKKYLDMMEESAMPEATKPWAEILTLTYLANKIDKNTFIDSLAKMNLDDAWKAAVDVLAHNTDKPEIENKCFEGLGSILECEPTYKDILITVRSIFCQGDNGYCFPSLSFVEKLFAFSTGIPDPDYFGFYQFPQWMLALSERDCDAALRACDLFLENCNIHMTTEACQALVKLLTVLFREAEEREEQDNGEMLLRVLHLQDTMLMKGISAMDDWFKEAERP